MLFSRDDSMNSGNDPDDDKTPKKSRRIKRNNDDVMRYLKEKNSNELELRKQEIELQREKLELENKRLENETAEKMMMDLLRMLANKKE